MLMLTMMFLLSFLHPVPLISTPQPNPVPQEPAHRLPVRLPEQLLPERLLRPVGALPALLLTLLLLLLLSATQVPGLLAIPALHRRPVRFMLPEGRRMAISLVNR